MKNIFLSISFNKVSKNVKYCGSIGLLLIEKSMIKGIRAILKVSTNTNKILRIINNIMDFLLFSVKKCTKFS